MITKEQIEQDAIEYLGITKEEFDKRRAICREERAKHWDKVNPQTPQEIDTYYATDPYIIENLVDFNTWAYDVHFPNPDHFGERALDFGCGLGYTGEHMAMNGKKVTLADVPTRAFKFAIDRFNKREYDYNALALRGGMLELKEEYDAIFCIDVIEHIVNPVEMLWHFYEHLSDGGKLYITNLHAKHDDIHKQHIIYQPPQIDKIMQLMGYKHLGGPVWQK